MQSQMRFFSQVLKAVTFQEEPGRHLTATVVLGGVLLAKI